MVIAFQVTEDEASPFLNNQSSLNGIVFLIRFILSFVACNWDEDKQKHNANKIDKYTVGYFISQNIIIGHKVTKTLLIDGVSYLPICLSINIGRNFVVFYFKNNKGDNTYEF